ncbi:hypothetical protein [Coleofasciculus sp. FACHB-129]|uniref:hypothetical protein n=1 Tax=Cyanophyceae TaxID=3028117 RepID=UPI0016837048|nr:hypothetical protein [Coleofasciculus sp. FACHB-129]MBD1895709.1 hypothetical protein [Coleofasciculus sp. FACHB-129]
MKLTLEVTIKLRKSSFNIKEGNMFQCKVSLVAPINLNVEADFFSVTIAEYDYDPGLQVGDEVLANFEQDSQEWEFVTLVTRRQNQVISKKNSQSIFRLHIDLEAKDREKLVKWAEGIKIKI